MNEHPILFSGPMVRAIREGRKTQTRRVMNPQPHNVEGMLFWKRGAKVYGLPVEGDPFTPLLGIWDVSPYGQPGDLLWVRETWGEKVDVGTLYKADGGVYATGGVVWKPSIHMRRSDSRLTLHITDVRVQRVQEISIEDCWAEGIKHCEWCDGSGRYEHPDYQTEEKCPECRGAVEEYESLWDSINAKRGYSWDSNPYVWVISFKREDA